MRARSRGLVSLGRDAELAAGVVLDLRKTAHLDLPDSLAGEVQDGAHLFEGDAAPICDVQRAGLRHLPDLEVRKVELDGAGLRIDVEVEVMRAGDEGAGTRHPRAGVAGSRSIDVRRIDQELRQATLVARQTLGRDGLRTHPSVAASRVHLAADAHDFWLRRVLILHASAAEVSWVVALFSVVHGLLLGRSAWPRVSKGRSRLPPPNRRMAAPRFGPKFDARGC